MTTINFFMRRLNAYHKIAKAQDDIALLNWMESNWHHLRRALAYGRSSEETQAQVAYRRAIVKQYDEAAEQLGEPHRSESDWWITEAVSNA